MIAKKVTRYYSDCGRGFWSKYSAIKHDDNCTCWKNPKLKSCLSCVNRNIVNDDNGMDGQYCETWQTNLCKHSDSGMPVHKEFDFIRKHCAFYKSKK